MNLLEITKAPKERHTGISVFCNRSANNPQLICQIYGIPGLISEELLILMQLYMDSKCR